jgi:SAM-dependent methyltransferase
MCIAAWRRFALAAEIPWRWRSRDRRVLRPTERFTSRVESYRQHRPGYPKGIVDLLTRECGLRADSLVADIAAGTGLLSEIFLERGYAVTAVEPNVAMREACQELTARFPKLACVAGTAEAAGLVDGSADLVSVGQAMHWFDLKLARAEFARVLSSRGWCAVIYNNRKMAGDHFHEEYERILVEFGSEYDSVRSSHLTEGRLAAFFAPDAACSAAFPNAQELAPDGLEGRILSSSYMPQPGHPRYAEMRRAVVDLFEREQRNGFVRMEYECVVTYGQLSTR